MPITKQQATTLRRGAVLLHMTMTNADGKTPVRCRVNGQCRTLKTQPDDFRLPVKYGLRECFYITPDNAADWCIEGNWPVEHELFRGVVK